MTTYTQSLPAMACLIDAFHTLSVDQITVAPSQNIVVGQVLGSVGIPSAETVSPAAGAGNVGNGAFGPVTTATNAVNGIYQVIMLSSGVTAEFDVQRPDGSLDGVGNVGTTYSGSIGFTIASGATPFALGDSFTVTVTRPAGQAGEQFEAWNPAATDGSQAAAAIALYSTTTGSGQTASIAALRRDGTARLSDLTWNASATPQQIAFATHQLAAKNIILR